MPRDSLGNYSLPIAAGNPVVSGSTVASSWANQTFADVALALTDSLDRQGRGSMLAPFEFLDGNEAAPGATWGAELNSGLYRSGSGDLRLTLLGQDLFRWYDGTAQIWDSGQTLWQTVSTVDPASGTGSVDPGTAIDQTLRWNGSGLWVPSAQVLIDGTGNLSTSGTISGSNIFLGGVQLGSLYAAQSINLIAGDGLSGGGTIASNVTFAVQVNTGIELVADRVQLDLTYMNQNYVQTAGGGGAAPVADQLNESTGTSPHPGSYYLDYGNFTGTIPVSYTHLTLPTILLV